MVHQNTLAEQIEQEAADQSPLTDQQEMAEHSQTPVLSISSPVQPQRTHPMVTRSLDGTRRPNPKYALPIALMASYKQDQEPTSFEQANWHPESRRAMVEEYEALTEFDMRFARDILNQHEIHVQHISAKDQLAIGLTKPPRSTPFHLNRVKLNVGIPQFSLSTAVRDKDKERRKDDGVGEQINEWLTPSKVIEQYLSDRVK